MSFDEFWTIESSRMLEPIVKFSEFSDVPVGVFW